MRQVAYMFNYFVPAGYPDVDASFDREIALMGYKLRGFDRRPVNIPGSVLTMQLFNMENGACVEFKKRGQPIYLNFLNFDESQSGMVFKIVEQFYLKCHLGTPKMPTQALWIHSVPVDPNIRLRDRETYLCEKLMVAVLAATYGKHKIEKNQKI